MSSEHGISEIALQQGYEGCVVMFVILGRFFKFPSADPSIHYKVKVNSSDHKIYSAWLSDYVDYSQQHLLTVKVGTHEGS